MDTSEQRVLRDVQAALEAGSRVCLCTIVASFGASPRPLGSMMALDESGQLSGSISGGCIEDDLQARLGNGEVLSADSGAAQIIEYGISAEENERFGLPCGGRLRILLESFSPGDTDKLAQIAQISEALDQRRAVRRTVNLLDGSWTLAALDRAGPLQLYEQGGQLRQDFGPRLQLLLVGANELARCIAELALAMDYRVLVSDPRPERRAQWPLASVPVLGGMPDDVLRQQACDQHSIVITLTHDPRIDDMALMEALTQPLLYIGALGSVRTSAKRRERLLQLGLDDKQLSALHAPVGLDIGSKSAMEIAVAVMAELTALRAGKAI